MVATTIELPNVRKLFIPDPGMYIGEADMSGAEAQVVAYEAGDEDLKAAFRRGENIHIKNSRAVYPELTEGLSDAQLKATDRPGGVYYYCKRFVHATHNGGKPKGIAQAVGTPVAQARKFQERWYNLHPAIRARHEYVMDCLHGNIEGNPPRTIFNKWGYRIVYFDQMENCFTKALTWIQQSTVAVNCFKGAIELRKIPWLQLLLQVHDSVIFQFPVSKLDSLKEIHDALHSIIIPYDDPLCIPWKLSISTRSWGHAEAVEW